MWWFGTTLKTLLGVVLVDAGKILQLARHFGPWGTVLGPFGSQNVYLNALNPLAHRVIFLTCTLQIKKAELLDPLPPPPLLPDLMSNKLTWELLCKIHREDSAKMESLSLYGLIEHFNVQIRESKSHPKIPRVYNYELWSHIHQRVKGSILPAQNRGKMDPQFITLSVRIYTSPWYIFVWNAKCNCCVFYYTI